MICASEENAICQRRLQILQNQYLKTFPRRCSHFPQIFIVLTAQPVTHTSLSSYGGEGGLTGQVLVILYLVFSSGSFSSTVVIYERCLVTAPPKIQSY